MSDRLASVAGAARALAITMATVEALAFSFGVVSFESAVVYQLVFIAILVGGVQSAE